jgi:hypothetical protein
MEPVDADKINDSFFVIITSRVFYMDRLELVSISLFFFEDFVSNLFFKNFFYVLGVFKILLKIFYFKYYHNYFVRFFLKRYFSSFFDFSIIDAFLKKHSVTKEDNANFFDHNFFYISFLFYMNYEAGVKQRQRIINYVKNFFAKRWKKLFFFFMVKPITFFKFDVKMLHFFLTRL